MKTKIIILSVLICLILGLSYIGHGFCAEYTIGPDDVLDVLVANDNNLSGTYTVDVAGNIKMQFLKEVKVSGLSTAKAASLISDRLKNEGFLVEPEVKVSVKEYRSKKVMVFGAVKKPGDYFIKDDTKVMNLLTQLEYQEKDGGTMSITRKKPSGEEETINVDLQALLLHGDMSQNIRILPGDNIILSSISAGKQGDMSSEEYVIGSDDVLDVSVWKDDTITGAYTVDKEGNVTMPYLKEVKVSDLPTIKAAELIASRLKNEGFLVNPVVTVSIKEYHSKKIMVFGKVKKPGSYYLKDKTMVLDLLSQIEHAEGGSGEMTILRKNQAGEEESISVDLHALVLNGDLSQNIEILGGDKVVISSKSTAQQIYVLGEVRQPGPYTMEKDLTVLQALQMAGGFTDFANKNKVKIIREEEGQKKNVIVNLNKISKGEKSEDVTLQAGDVLVALKSWF